jgi:importin-5
VRYAALHLLGQFSDDLKPEFQELYYDSFIKFTTKLLVDPVPRVVAHTFACATNFFEDCKDLWKI